MTTATKSAPAATNNGAKPTGPSEHIRTLAGIFEKGITVNKDGTTKVDEDLIEANLPDDLTIQQIKRTQKHRGEVVAALGLALSNKTLPVMEKNKDLDRVTIAVKIGGDKLELGLDRSKQFNDGKGGKLEKRGYLSVGYTATGATNAGEFKKVREAIAQDFQNLFGG